MFNFAAKSTYSIHVRTTDSSSNSFDKVYTISVVPEANTVAIGDLVWNDRNANGRQDAGEPGVSGVVVELYCSPTGVVGGFGRRIFRQQVLLQIVETGIAEVTKESAHGHRADSDIAGDRGCGLQYQAIGPRQEIGRELLLGLGLRVLLPLEHLDLALQLDGVAGDAELGAQPAGR